METIFVCKKVLKLEIVKISFEVGKKYIANRRTMSVYSVKDDNDNKIIFHISNQDDLLYTIGEYFMSLQEYRQLKIKEILL